MALSIAHELLPQFDAFQDNPWANLFREMDREVPGSRFVMTVRPEEEWLRSVVGHFGPRSTPMREWIYGPGLGSPRGNEALYVERYRRHNREVLEHFADRPDDLFVMDITEGDGWDSLFLPRARRRRWTVPHSNPATRRSEAGVLQRARWRVRWATRRLRR